jgi:hypothetical protein
MKQTLFLIPLFILLGCSRPVAPKASVDKSQCMEKSWMYTPSYNGKSGAVGSSRMHVRGRAEQRKLAISRALDELATQMGVKVKNITLVQASADRSGSNTNIDTISHQTANTKVNAYIKEVCHDTYRDEIFIWMVAK